MSDWGKYIHADLNEERIATIEKGLNQRLHPATKPRRRLRLFWVGAGLLFGGSVAYAAWSIDDPEPSGDGPVAAAPSQSTNESPSIGTRPDPEDTMRPIPSAQPTVSEPARDAPTEVAGSRPLAPSARPDLFADATRFRREGLHARAARTYERFLLDSPSDVRAPVAAFQLGLLYADHLGNPREAVASLERARALGADPLWREELLARLASAYESIGDLESCRRARERYRDFYPSGNYTEQLSQSCSP
ncbi:MAG: tetratricopeptide repeat protein [Myxococcota bacterium]